MCKLKVLQQILDGNLESTQLHISHLKLIQQTMFEPLLCLLLEQNKHCDINSIQLETSQSRMFHQAISFAIEWTLVQKNHEQTNQSHCEAVENCCIIINTVNLLSIKDFHICRQIIIGMLHQINFHQLNEHDISLHSDMIEQKFKYMWMLWKFEKLQVQYITTIAEISEIISNKHYQNWYMKHKCDKNLILWNFSTKRNQSIDIKKSTFERCFSLCQSIFSLCLVSIACEIWITSNSLFNNHIVDVSFHIISRITSSDID